MQSDFYGNNNFENPFFIGTVEDNNDPTFNYRVKVRIPLIHNDVMSTDQLPWAARVSSPFMGTSDESDLDHAVPEIGSQVLILAVGNDPNSLIYLGVLHKKTAQTPSDNKYLDTYGIYRKNGQFIGVDKIQKLFQMLFEGDIEVDKVRNIKINASNAITITCNQADITTNGATNLTANGNLNVTAPMSKIQGNVEISGNIECTGNAHITGPVSSDAEVTAMGGSVGLSTHVHPGIFPGPGMTAPGQG